MRIALGGFLHESHSFVPATTFANFALPGSFPPLCRGAAMLEAVRGTSLAVAGALDALERAGAEPVPLSWCFANPAGPVARAAFERICGILLAQLSDALEQGPLDGVYLDLHGAMVSDDFADAEAEVLRRVRAVVGEGVPVTASLDPHANMTREMCELADALAPFRTYPHVDMREAGARAAGLLLARIRRGAPWSLAYRQPDYLTPITSQCTMVEPMAGVMEARARAEGGAAELAWCFGFPYADFEGCGPAIAAWADTREEADRAADALLAEVARREPQFADASVVPAEAAVAEALRLAAGGADKPVVIADTQDNPGGGGHGDTTGLLAELLRQGARDTAFGLINDAESAGACHAAGEGATVALDLGGKSDGAPLRVTGVVERLSDGRFKLTGPMGRGNPANLGPSALLRVGGVRVVVVSRKMQCLDQQVLRHLGLDPTAQRILAVKSSVHFRADFQPIAAAVLVAAAPGPVVADPSALPFRNLRRGLRLRPGDNRRFGE
jgi:microcystin degradation protein MlrC